MKPSDLGLIVYRYHYLDKDGMTWKPSGFSLATPESFDTTKERYEPTDDVPDEIGGLAVYLFSTEQQLNAFIAGMHALGDDLIGCSARMTNLGCLGLIKEFPSHQAFTSCTRGEDCSHIAVFDLRGQDGAGASPSNALRMDLPVYHRNAKAYGGNITASPEFIACIVDQRAERGEMAFGLCPSGKNGADNQILVTAGLDTVPGGARTVPALQIHHQASYRRLFRFYKWTAAEHLLIPDPMVKFKPHLMDNGTMAFIVADEGHGRAEA